MVLEILISVKILLMIYLFSFLAAAIMLWLRSVVDEITSEPGEWFNW